VGAGRAGIRTSQSESLSVQRDVRAGDGPPGDFAAEWLC